MKLGGTAGLVALGVYHHAVHHGVPWLFPAALYEHSLLDLRPSIGMLARGAAYTALHGLRLLAWTFPLLPFLAWMGARRPAPGNVLLLGSIAGLIAFYFLYPSAGGPQYGPRYYFGLLGPLAILGARGLGATPRSFRVLLFACAVALFAVRVPLEAARAARVNAPFRLAAAARLDHAIVFLNNVNRSDSGRNLPGWNGPILFVQDQGRRDSTLLARYPDRAAYRFFRISGEARLEPVSHAFGP
jgi:hypothetical protein